MSGTETSWHIKCGAIIWLAIALLGPPHAFAFTCQRLLHDATLVKMKRFVRGEFLFYEQDPSEVENFRLICERGCLRYMNRSRAFDTTEAIIIHGEIEAPAELGILLANGRGELLGLTRMMSGISHHSTLVDGQDVFFAGMVQTNRTGKILGLNYNSGHYAHGPYALKLLIDDLGGPEVLAGAYVQLSDLPGVGPGNQPPQMPVEDFYKYCVSDRDTGSDVGARYRAALTSR